MPMSHVETFGSVLGKLNIVEDLESQLWLKPHGSTSLVGMGRGCEGNAFYDALLTFFILMFTYSPSIPFPHAVREGYFNINCPRKPQAQGKNLLVSERHSQ